MPVPAGEGECRFEHVVLAGERVHVVRFHGRQLIGDGQAFRRPVGNLDPHQLRGRHLAQPGDHRLEELEALGLVFVQRVALAIAAQADDLAQMVERDDMLAPELVEGLQQHRFST